MIKAIPVRLCSYQLTDLSDQCSIVMQHFENSMFVNRILIELQTSSDRNDCEIFLDLGFADAFMFLLRSYATKRAFSVDIAKSPHTLWSLNVEFNKALFLALSFSLIGNDVPQAVGEGEVAFFSAKRWDRRNRAGLIKSATPCHDAQVLGSYQARGKSLLKMAYEISNHK